jgi:hypothetical protein
LHGGYFVSFIFFGCPQPQDSKAILLVFVSDASMVLFVGFGASPFCSQFSIVLLKELMINDS